MSDKIICRINDSPKIRVRIHDEPTIKINFGSQGLKGDKGDTGPGTTDHSLLTKLDYDVAGHTNFQKKITYVPEYKAYQVP